MRPISRFTTFAAGAVLTAALIPASSAVAHDRGDDGHQGRHDHGKHAARLLSAPVAGSLITDPTLFGAAPGGAPWTIKRGSAELRTDGRLDVSVTRLIIPTTGVNPVPRLAASVACNGTVVATTATVAFSTTGDARVRAKVKLPERCLAPAVLLSPNGTATTYIAATGAAS